MKSYSKKFEGYSISACTTNDIENVMRFIDIHWVKGHVLSQSRELMDWQYYNRKWERYNVLMGIDNENGGILGIISYIPTYLYDDGIDDKNKYLWLTIWKVRNDIAKKVPPIGIALIHSVFDIEGTENIGTIGINRPFEPLYRLMKFDTGLLTHFFIVNSTKIDFKLLSGDIPKSPQKSESDFKLSLLYDEASILAFYDKLESVETYFPLKTKEYFINRYVKHPYYNYSLYGLESSQAPVSLLVCRIVSANDATAIRIVDFFGSASKMAGSCSVFHDLLLQHDAEYIDIYCHGLDQNHLTAAGFTLKTEDSGIVVPNYYEPFTATNVDILYAYHTDTDKQFCIFKGDCDQDRPNKLSKESV
jgi:hypothetical protein